VRCALGGYLQHLLWSVVILWQKKKLTSYTLYGKSFHFTYEIVCVDANDGTHEVFDAISCEHDPTKRDIGGAACHIE
jgi:hypothetical protein